MRSSPKVGLDVGFGLDMVDDGSESATNFFFEVGVPFVLIPTERVNLYLRPGVQMGIFDEALSPEVENRIAISLAPGVEFFLTDDLSIEAAHGITYEIWAAREEGVDNYTEMYTFGDSFTFLGFHFYVK